MNVSFVKSFSQGQITIPKSIRDEMGIGKDFWLKVYIDDEKIVAEPVSKSKMGRDEYLLKLKKIKTDWFDEADYKNIRKEINKRSSV